VELIKDERIAICHVVHCTRMRYTNVAICVLVKRH